MSKQSRPVLNSNIKLKDFCDFYWLKSELLKFCRENDLSMTGGKLEIKARIEQFLKTGERSQPRLFQKKDSHRPQAMKEPLSLNSKVTEGFRCTREIRDFFELHAGKSFHFSVKLQEYIKQNPGITFQQVIQEWRLQTEAKRSGQKKDEIAPQFEFNRFVRDYFSDPKNAGKTRKDCLMAWAKVRSTRGSRTYRPE